MPYESEKPSNNLPGTQQNIRINNLASPAPHILPRNNKTEAYAVTTILIDQLMKKSPA